jgi:hypothetical protein
MLVKGGLYNKDLHNQDGNQENEVKKEERLDIDGRFVHQ